MHTPIMELDNIGVDSPNNTGSQDCEGLLKYNFRQSSVIKRIRVEEKQKLPKGSKVRDKSKPQPLSKYRRKSANARERSRITDMNLAYEQLRLALPEMTISDNNCKLPKQTILRLALNYIIALRGVLGYQNGINSDCEHSVSSSQSICSSEEESNSCSDPYTAETNKHTD